MKTHRWKVYKASEDVIEELKRRTVNKAASYGSLLIQHCKDVPQDAKVLAVSVHYFWHENAVALRVESETFPEVPEGGLCPIVDLELKAWL